MFQSVLNVITLVVYARQMSDTQVAFRVILLLYLFHTTTQPNMIPLLLGCIVGGCLDVPIDTRPIHRQIIEDQLTPKPTVERNPWGFDIEDEDNDKNWRDR